jgi:N-acetylmuramoyl-L-alanine amidase
MKKIYKNKDELIIAIFVGITFIVVAAIMVITVGVSVNKPRYILSSASTKMIVEEPLILETRTPTEEPIATEVVVTASPIPEETAAPIEPSISEEEIRLLAIVTMAEAEGECEYGKRLVIDTILNRVDSIHWPDTITEVIYEPEQFTCMWNGRFEKCYVMDDIYQLVLEELESRTNYEVVYFRTKYYCKFGEPMFQVGNHYFSKSFD